MSQPWPEVPIKETYLGLFDGPHATPPVSDEGPVFLGIGNVTEDGHLDLSDVRHINEADFPKWTKRVTPQPGDIVFTYEATLNRYAIVPEGFRGCLGRRMALIRPNPAKVDTRFLHYTFFSPIEANRLAGATVDRIPLTRFPDFPVRLPPLPTQRKIAAILSAYDDLIENNTRRVRVLEQMARALYREWFVEYRFPGHEQAEWIEDEAGRRPQGWEQKKLGDIAMELRRSVEPSEIAPDTHYVGLEHIPRRKIALDDWGTAADVQSTKLRFDAGDVLFGKIRPYFHKVSVAPMGGVCSTDAIVIKALKPELRPLMVMTVASDEFVEHSVQTSNGTKMPRANWKVLTQYPVVVPPSELLEKFNAIVEDVIQQGANFTQRNANLRQTRDLLLPRLVSGELDVSGLRVVGVEEGLDIQQEEQ